MRVFFLEDDLDFAKEILAKAKELGVSEVVHVRNRDEAIQEIDKKEFFDLAILDLRVPPSDPGTPDSTHGNAVFEHIRRARPGTPIWFLTAFHADNEIVEKFGVASKGDVFGSGNVQPLVDVIPKSKLDRLLAQLKTWVAELELVNAIELKYEGAGNLSLEERRVLRLFARSIGGSATIATRISPGLSGATVFRVLVKKHGNTIGSAIAKLATHDKVLDEKGRYKYVALLQAGAYATEMAFLDSGAGSLAGLFYRLAEGYDLSLLKVIENDPKAACSYLERLAEIDKPWIDGGSRQSTTLAAIRRAMISDRDLAVDVVSDLVKRIAWPRDQAQLEGRTLEINHCVRHGDLHCENVLTTKGHGGMLIDYGRVGVAPASLDAITLELGLVFHPDAKALRKGWPSAKEAASWGDLPAEPMDDCPCKEFVARCRIRRNEVAAGKREILATYYAFLMRQLKFDGTDKTTLIAILQSVINSLEATYL